MVPSWLKQQWLNTTASAAQQAANHPEDVHLFCQSHLSKWITGMPPHDVVNNVVIVLTLPIDCRECALVKL